MNAIFSDRAPAGSGHTLTVPARSTPPDAARHGLALVPGSGGCLTDEVHCLLHRRLRIAGLICWCALTALLVRNYWLRESLPDLQSYDLAAHTAVVGILTLLLSWLWSNPCQSGRMLRGVELIMFGALAAHLAYLQIRWFHGGLPLEWADDANRERILTLSAQTNSLRWFILIVLYGTFIPNTWKRCTVIVGLLALLPVVLTYLVCFRCPIMGQYTWTATFDMTVILGVGAAIAIFGSYKISTLHAQAFEARKLGQYVLREKIGSGGMGEVYLGEHVLLRRACAIKVIHPDQAGDPTNLTRFEREVRAMATLTHWNTVEVYDYGRADDGTFYYVMEYLPGLSLQTLVEKHGPLPPGRAIHFLRQICAALKEAHSVGLIHRDIKPSNVLVCERGGVHDVVKLLDFGLVHSLGITPDAGKLTVQGSILGSPPYMSPEQAMSKSNVDARTDIYSLGGLGYFLLTGQPPFVRDSAMEHLVAHVHEPLTPPRALRLEVPEDLEEVLLRCLHKKPEDRYADIRAVDYALADCDAASAWDADQAARWWRDQTTAERDEAWVVNVR